MLLAGEHEFGISFTEALIPEWQMIEVSFEGPGLAQQVFNGSKGNKMFYLF